MAGLSVSDERHRSTYRPQHLRRHGTERAHGRKRKFIAASVLSVFAAGYLWASHIPEENAWPVGNYVTAMGGVSLAMIAAVHLVNARRPPRPAVQLLLERRERLVWLMGLILLPAALASLLAAVTRHLLPAKPHREVP